MIRGRYAPSPTGELHLGNMRTALLAWLQVRAAGGTLVMRVEDLDERRVRLGMIERQLDDLLWLGLDWDEGPRKGGPHAPYLQSRRAELYEQALERLADDGHLFSCYCSRKEIAEAASAPHGPEDEGPIYPGTCRELPDAQAGRRARERDAALRLRVPDEVIDFEDLLQGRVRYDAARDLGDFVVRRKDGIPAYQLAVTVDDAAMEITHVLRGADLLPSTARQILIYRALDLPTPAWIHVPLMLGPDGERLSKRHGAVSLREVRDSGASPERVIGWMAASCGLAEKGDEMSAAELIHGFSLEKLPKEATVVEHFPIGE